MPSTQHPLIAREGWPALTVVAGAGLLLYAVLGYAGAAPAVVLLLALLILLRDPYRESHSLPLSVISPLDGRVVDAGIHYDPWLGREAVRIAVRSGVLDVHSIYSPIEGKLMEQWTRPKHAFDDEPVGSHTIAYHIRTDEGDNVVMEIARGAWHGPVRFRYQPGERVGHARRVGFAPLGCDIVVYAPEASRIDVSTGARAVAASTPLATLVHEKAVSSLGERALE